MTDQPMTSPTDSPMGEGLKLREAVARIVCFWDKTGTCHDAYCGAACAAIRVDAEHHNAADAILALPQLAALTSRCDALEGALRRIEAGREIPMGDGTTEWREVEDPSEIARQALENPDVR